MHILKWPPPYIELKGSSWDYRSGIGKMPETELIVHLQITLNMIQHINVMDRTPISGPPKILRAICKPLHSIMM